MRKYNGIQKIFKSRNHYQQSITDKIIMSGIAHNSILWTIREKIHGANYSFWYNGSEMKFAKRTSFVGEFDNFFNHHVIVKRYKDNIINAYNSLVSNGVIEQGGLLTLYGEIAGTMLTGRKVQREVDYGDLDFYAFDIKVNGVYLDDLEVESLCENHNIRTAPLLATGKFNELFEIDNDFKTVVHQQSSGDKKFVLYYEEDSYEADIAEGYVLKPNKTQYFENGTRVAIKSKNKKFSEKKKHAKIKKAKDEAIELTESDQSLLETLETFNTDNRLRNVLSKFGSVTQKDFGKILNLMYIDVVEDFNKEYEVSDIPHPVAKVFRGRLSADIGKNFGAIINGWF